MAWRVQGAPSWFRSIELQEALLGAGWTEIQVLYPPRGKQPWLIKAKPPPNSEGEILGVATGDFTLYLSRVPPRAPHVVGIKPVHITRKAQPAHEVNLNTEAEDLETELEDPPSADANMTGEAAKDPAKKRDPPEKQSPLKKKHKESAPNFLQGYELKDCCGDGACGYNSLAFAYWLSNNADKPHPSNEEIKTMGRTLRQQIHQHICKHQGKYSATFATDARWTKETEGREVPTTFDSWLLALLRPQRWICQTTLQAAANRLGVHITVLINNQNDTRAVHIPCQQLNFATTVVIYLKDKHYQAVLPTRKAWPLEWTSLAEKLGEISRGGGPHATPVKASGSTDWLPSGTPSSSSRRAPSTPPTWMPASTPRKSPAPMAPPLTTPRRPSASQVPSRTSSRKKRSAAWLPDATPRGTPCTFTSSSSKKSSAKEAKAAPRIEQPAATRKGAETKLRGTSTVHQPATQQKDGTWTWPCPHCDVVLRGKSSRNLSSRRTSHMLFRHKDIPFEDRGTRINRTEIVEASFDVPEGERDWECPFRHEYLPQFGNYHQKQKNVRHHYDTKHPRRNTSPGAIQKALAKSVKKDPSRFPKKKSGYMQAAAKRRAKERDLGLNGHKLIAFQPVWSEWPRPKKGKPQKGQLFTCQKCWGIANYNKHMWKPCTGSRGEASRQAVNRWAGICAGPSGDNVSTLLACWGTTKAEADMYFNHLEEEGVEPNPGPETPGGADDDDDGGSDDDDPDPSDPSSTASHEQSDQTQSSTARSSVRVSCVNVRDGPGLWRLVKILECDSSFTDVICIQESCIHAEEYNTVANKFSAMGFKAYWAEGSPGKKATGGCVTVVRSTIPHRVVEIFSGGPHQHICIEFKSSWMVCNSYIPPRQHLRYIAHQAFTEILHKIKLSAGGRPWIALGDYNALPQEMEAVFSPHGGTLFYQQCRFQGNRYIDHIWSNEHNFLAEGKVLPYKVSDHKWFSTIRWDAESHRCVRRRGHVWSSPPGVPFATWKEHLAVTWEQCDRSFLESFAAAEANPSQATVDMVWQEWNSYLHNFFSVATSSFSQSLQGSSRTGLAAWSKKAEQAGSKPSKPHLQWIPKLVRRESGNMACRKRCNWLSRAERVLELMNKSSRSHNQDTELQRLMCRIRRRMPSTHEFPVFVRQLAEEIKQTQKQQAQEERETKDLFIQRWRHSMQYSVSERCKWLRKSKQCRPYVLHGDRQLDKDQDILNAICEHWQATWRACKHAPVQPKIQVVLNNLPEQVPLSGRPDLEDFSTALKELGGSSGPDDWQLEELRCLPPGAIPLFSRLTCTWEASGCTPGTLKYSRQVNLAKPHKIVNGCTKSSDLRPINVYSLWYRWWSGSWAKSKLLRSWRQRVFPAEITGGLNSPGSEHLAAKLQDALVQHGYLATLDYSLAFDHVVPAAVSLGMERLGLPKALSSVLLDQWTHQKRILQWNCSTFSRLLCADMSVPQGDASSPLALNILMFAGFNYVKRHCAASPTQRLHVVYMDDRSWTSSSARLLLSTLRTWHSFSARAGLRENETKTQITYANPDRKQDLLIEIGEDETLLEALTPSAVVLGCGTSCEEQRQPNDKELQRIQDAQHTCKRIRLLPLAHTEKLFTARLTAVSKAAFGWVAATPSEALSKAFDTAVRATSDAFREGSKHLHNVLLGVTRCLSPVVGVKQVLLWCKSLAQEQWDDTRRRVSTLQRLAQDFLHQVGWVFTRGKWAHRSLAFSGRLKMVPVRPAGTKSLTWCASRGGTCSGSDSLLRPGVTPFLSGALHMTQRGSASSESSYTTLMARQRL